MRRLAEGRTHAPLPLADTVTLTRGKVEPMVRGLFPRVEQDAVLATLEKSVVFVTRANLYLASVGTDLLAETHRASSARSRHEIADR